MVDEDNAEAEAKAKTKTEIEDDNAKEDRQRNERNERRLARLKRKDTQVSTDKGRLLLIKQLEEEFEANGKVTYSIQMKDTVGWYFKLILSLEKMDEKQQNKNKKMKNNKKKKGSDNNNNNNNGGDRGVYEPVEPDQIGL